MHGLRSIGPSRLPGDPAQLGVPGCRTGLSVSRTVDPAARNVTKVATSPSTYRLEGNTDMNRDAADILRDALDLPPEARAALAGSLLDSLDQTVDEDAESAWGSEIVARLKELDEGRVQLVPWAEARRRIADR